jgi:hypothetical protein
VPEGVPLEMAGFLLLEGLGRNLLRIDNFSLGSVDKRYYFSPPPRPAASAARAASLAEAVALTPFTAARVATPIAKWSSHSAALLAFVSALRIALSAALAAFSVSQAAA